MNELSLNKNDQIQNIINVIDPEQFWCIRLLEYVFKSDCSFRTPAIKVDYKSGRCYACLRPNETQKKK